jgi:hypothetical protein
VISTTSYTYDADNRLTSHMTATRLGAQSRVASSYDANSNLLDDTTYDAQGVAQARTSYSYDAWDRLTVWQRQTAGQPNATQTATFQYDGSGARTAMTYGGATTTFLAAGAQVLEERRSGQPTQSYLYTPGASVALFRADANGVGEWYHHDPQGSVRAASNGTSATSTHTYAFDAFGVTTGTSGPATNNRQFSGAQHDPTDLYYSGCGYYDPATTRLIGGCGGGAGRAGVSPLSPAGGASPAGAYPLGPVRPTSGGNGLDAASAQQLGRTLGHAPSGAFLPFGQPACGVSCRYTVTLVKQPDPPPTTESGLMQMVHFLGDLSDRAVGVLGQLNAAQRAYTGFDFPTFWVQHGRQWALNAAGVVKQVAVAYFKAAVWVADIATDFIPETAVAKGVFILAFGRTIHGEQVSRWDALLLHAGTGLGAGRRTARGRACVPGDAG